MATMYFLGDKGCPKDEGAFEGEPSPVVVQWMLLKFTNDLREFRPPDAQRLEELARETAVIYSGRQALYGDGWRLSWV